jgi:hypothetical protein
MRNDPRSSALHSSANSHFCNLLLLLLLVRNNNKIVQNSDAEQERPPYPDKGVELGDAVLEIAKGVETGPVVLAVGLVHGTEVGRGLTIMKGSAPPIAHHAKKKKEKGSCAYHLDEEVAYVGQREVVDVFIIVAVQVG